LFEERFKLTTTAHGGDEIAPIEVYSDWKPTGLSTDSTVSRPAKIVGLQELQANITPGTYADREEGFRGGIEAIRKELQQWASDRAKTTQTAQPAGTSGRAYLGCVDGCGV
jgi:hypothetical protein